METAAFSPPSELSAKRPCFPVWILAGAVLLPLLYLPMLASRFDFIDDGNLVYSSPSMPLGERVGVVWSKIVANYEDLGPFRPVLWCHWELAADLLQESEFGWRLLRLIWCGFATAMFLWFMAELGLPAGAALLAVTLAMWNPYRSEIWTSLTLGEGVAMPYALLGLVCACRAPRSPRAWVWDVVGMLAVLAALGCKNTFGALLPAQMFLRLGIGQLPLSEGLRRHGWRALMLGATMVAPVAHFIYFKMHWHPGQYVTSPPTTAQGLRILRCLAGAMSVDFLGVGIALCGAAVLAARWRSGRTERISAPGALPANGSLTWVREFPGAVGAGLLLTLAGAAVYLPMDAISPRYSMPAVWGLDLLLAVLLTRAFRLATPLWKNVAVAALACGLVATVIANFGKQQKFMARSNMLWEALECVERDVPAGSTVAFYCGDPLKSDLDASEGIHFQWHLSARGRKDLRIALFDAAGQPLERIELTPNAAIPSYAVWGRVSPSGVACQARKSFTSTFHLGRKSYECTLAEIDAAPVPISHSTTPH